ncbi:sigma-54 interaction domain-containing protein [Desulfitobacterium hafniense]|uniref:Sigma-54 factor interaction domain-containing protein n=1 Tax=Desulfitobacterium hafniense (strain Y51) TaxID=138119 RepID=Q24QW1_DESHY|nr:sigma 54-interacting transcriptional regulator [Desulfitobacterium hafniense]BAE85581.1 hypothetical protein DSY3792 [Desulfitobacterium hafniense Y51]
MYVNYNDCAQRNIESFFPSLSLPEKEVRKEVAQSWEKCKERQLDKKIARIKTPSTFSKDAPIREDLLYLRDNVLPMIVSCLHEMLSVYQGAVFYAYENGIIFCRSGNKDLLRYLNSLNIGIGTCITESYMGTTGLVFVTEPDQDGWVIGEEHYLDILTPYVTYCYQSEDFNGLIYTMIIIPKEKFNDLSLLYFRLFHRARKVKILDYRKELELKMKTELFEQILQTGHQAILYVDSFGKILNTNSLFIEWFQLKAKDIINVDCTEIFPELGRALTSLQTGKRIIYEEIFLEKASPDAQFLRMDVIPMTQDEKISGLTIALSNSKTVRQTVNRLHHAQANFTFNDIIGDSKVIKELKVKAMNTTHSNSSIVITGESGTGKELFAQAIHNESLRKKGPFVALNCAALQPELIASELFGYVEGAFTGARKGGSMGKFEYAHKGTLFLDEIGELPMFAQVVLLRVLEEHAVTRIGSNITIPVDVRLICATNRDLKKMVKEGSFRLDLYYRINVIHLHIPPLRERITDIPILVDHFIDRFNQELNKKVTRVTPEALAFLMSYPWAGNLRELRNTVECGMNNTMGEVLELHDLPGDIFDDDGSEELHNYEGRINRKSKGAKEEKEKIISSLMEHNGNKVIVAAELGIARSTLYKKLKDYNLL